MRSLDPSLLYRCRPGPRPLSTYSSDAENEHARDHLPIRKGRKLVGQRMEQASIAVTKYLVK